MELKNTNVFIIGMILGAFFNLLRAKGFNPVKNAQEIGKIALYSEIIKDFVRDFAGIKNEIENEIVELKKQKQTLDEIKKQNEEIIKYLSNEDQIPCIRFNKSR